MRLRVPFPETIGGQQVHTGDYGIYDVCEIPDCPDAPPGDENAHAHLTEFRLHGDTHAPAVLTLADAMARRHHAR